MLVVMAGVLVLFLRMKQLTELTGDLAIIAINRCGYGIGENIETAAKKCRADTRRKPSSFWLVPKGTTTDGMIISYPRTAKFSRFAL
jgi:hypothetical protein